MNITSVKAIEILDSRGKPTVRAYVTLANGSVHAASVPSGASTGAHEAVELRDGDPKRHAGQGVLNAVAHVNEELHRALKGKDVRHLADIDKTMLELDGTENKEKLGANAMLAVSMAAVRAASYLERLPVWKFVNQHYFLGRAPAFPRLMVNVVNGGKHAGWNFDIQEFMIIPQDNTPSVSTRIAAEIFQMLGKQLKSKKLSTLVGDEGGYSPALSSNESVLEEIVQAAVACGYTNTKEFRLALDCASTEFFENGAYVLKKTHETKTPAQMIEYYAAIGQKYSIESFEDPFAEDDWDSFHEFTKLAKPHGFQVVGDDLFVTNPKRIKEGIEKQSATAVLIKLNQIGTVWETVQAVRMTQDAHWKVAVSHRSGETEDAFIADFAYGCGADFIKTGSMSRSERLAKYNRLLEIEHGM